MRKWFLLLPLLFLSALFACDRRARMAGLAEEHIRQSLEVPNSLAIQAVSEPDSAFGSGYLSPHEVNSLTALLQKVNAVIMSRTKNMTEFNPDDHYVIDLADRQMRALSDLRSMTGKSKGKGGWTGWKIKVDYSAKGSDGERFRAERWIFFDKKGKNVTRSFELPLP